MGYREEVEAGYTFELLTPQETCQGPDCKLVAEAHVRFVAPAGAKGAHIKAFCSRCGFRRELGIQKYGPRLVAAFPEIAAYLTSTARKKRSKVFEAGSPEFYARFDWCCVYCEGFRLAREYRLKQIESLESGALVNEATGDLQLDESNLEMRTSDLLAGNRALQNIFDLVPDHIFPVWIQELPDLVWEDSAKLNAERSWVVSAHRSCNSKRKQRLESADFLLFVYSRYLFPQLELSEREKVLDMLAFANVLHRLELYKERHQIAELKVPRRAI